MSSTITIDIRRAHDRDATQIATVHDASWRQAYAGIIPARSLLRMVQRRGSDWWSLALKRGVEVLLIEVGDKIVGYATFGGNRVGSLPYEAEIYELYLLPEYQGVGLGKRLFNAAISHLKKRGQRKIVVWALTDNDNAMQFYRNAGGEQVASGFENFEDKRLEKRAFGWH